MKHLFNPSILGAFGILIFSAMIASQASRVLAQVVPGTGRKISQVGDDFEDPKWKFIAHWPKSSNNLDKNDREPGGESKNGRWFEGVKRGQPDYIRRVATPEGGLPGSKGSLLLRSLYTGIPYRPSGKMQQDDFIADVKYQLNGAIPTWQSPNVVVRVYMPPFEKWEKRSGPTFAFRVSLEPRHVKKQSSWSFFRSSKPKEPPTYWPGFLIDFQSKHKGYKKDSAFFRIRCDDSGNDNTGPEIKKTGWWTLGLSLTPDGRVHYYAKPGIENLTAKDRIASHFPYGEDAIEFNTFFFNICSGDDGRTWSTPWIIDDPTVYYIPRRR